MINNSALVIARCRCPVYALIAADGLDHTLQNAPVKQVMRTR